MHITLPGFKDRTFGSSVLGTTRVYDNAMHIANTAYLLVGGENVNNDTRSITMPGVPYPFYLVDPLPFGYTTQEQFGGELGEISRRVMLGQYNNP